MNDETVKATEIIDEQWLDVYRQQHDIIYSQLVGLQTKLFTLERLEEFPFYLFFPLYDDRIFWQTVRNALIEAIIVGFFRVFLDTENDAITLRKLKNGIQHNTRDDEAREKLKKMWGKSDLDQKMQNLERKLRDARNKFIGHLDRNEHSPENIAKVLQNPLTLEDLKNIHEHIHRLFDKVSFEIHGSLWLWGYSEYARKHRTTDIDRLLDTVAQHSSALNSPERDPVGWSIIREKISIGQLNIFNMYRLRCGLPEVS